MPSSRTFTRSLSDYSGSNRYVLSNGSDGHITISSCYAYFQARHSFDIAAWKGDDGITNVYLVPDLADQAVQYGFDEYYTKQGFNASYLNYLSAAKVNAINGREVWDYLENVTVAEGTEYQDAQQRLNQVFSHTNSFQQEGPYFSREHGTFGQPAIIGNDTITLSVTTEDGTDVDVEVPIVARWVQQGNWTYTDALDLWVEMHRSRSP